MTAEVLMELEGVVQNGVIVPDDTTALPEGTRVLIIPAPTEKPKPFGETQRVCLRTWPLNMITIAWGTSKR